MPRGPGFPPRRALVCVAGATRAAVENSRTAVHHLSTPDFCPINRHQLLQLANAHGSLTWNIRLMTSPIFFRGLASINDCITLFQSECPPLSRSLSIEPILLIAFLSCSLARNGQAPRIPAPPAVGEIPLS